MNWDLEMQEYDGTFIRETPNAILFLPEEFEKGEEIWLPKSRIDYEDKDYDEGDCITLSIENWLAMAKGLI